MGESERTSAGTTRMRMREILNYRCECELGIRNEMGTFMLESFPKSGLTKVERLKLRMMKKKNMSDLFYL
jgi:hypothetical protein